MYGLCAGVQQQVRDQRRIRADQEQVAEIDIFMDGSFAYFRSVLDSVLKDLHRQGIGTTTISELIASLKTSRRSYGRRMYLEMTHQLS